VGVSAALLAYPLQKGVNEMATQGIVSVTKNGKTIIKAVAGCNGFQAAALTAAIKERHKAGEEITAGWVEGVAREVRFGCDDCLVVVSESGWCGALDNLSPLYRQTFSDPRFNPRWRHGTADHVRVIKIGDRAKRGSVNEEEEEGPGYSKEVALAFAQEAIHIPTGPIASIAKREKGAYAQLTFMGDVWHCSLSFAGAMYGATGRHEQLGHAVRQAILRAYDAGEEEGWQQKAFKEKSER
jgi:hypothetical protein